MEAQGKTETTEDAPVQHNDALFCIFDGHGKDGDGCAKLAQDHLPITLREQLLQHQTTEIIPKDPLLECSITQAHITVNNCTKAQRRL